MVNVPPRHLLSKRKSKHSQGLVDTCDGEPTTVDSVSRFVQCKLRNSQGKLRDLLLTGIQEVPGRDINHPVPSISALLAEALFDSDEFKLASAFAKQSWRGSSK
ncbi:hypothetical protein PtB15_6B402 [Puccinia triticina]|nr:hypothetical protein PtB15_6B402 [Puccinia triticina]